MDALADFNAEEQVVSLLTEPVGRVSFSTNASGGSLLAEQRPIPADPQVCSSTRSRLQHRNPRPPLSAPPSPRRIHDYFVGWTRALATTSPKARGRAVPAPDESPSPAANALLSPTRSLRCGSCRVRRLTSMCKGTYFWLLSGCMLLTAFGWSATVYEWFNQHPPIRRIGLARTLPLQPDTAWGRDSRSFQTALVYQEVYIA